MRLRFYEKEKEMFPICNETILTDAATRIVIQKLRRHYKLRRDIVVTFRKPKGGMAHYRYKWSITKSGIRIQHNPTLLLVIHEFAHIHNRFKFQNGAWNHNKKLLRTIAKCARYCKTKKLWIPEIFRRTGEGPIANV